MLIVLFFERSLSDLFTTEALAAQALQILASGSALIASVPITTAIATLAVRKPTEPSEPDRPCAPDPKESLDRL